MERLDQQDLGSALEGNETEPKRWSVRGKRAEKKKRKLMEG